MSKVTKKKPPQFTSVCVSKELSVFVGARSFTFAVHVDGETVGFVIPRGQAKKGLKKLASL